MVSARSLVTKGIIKIVGTDRSISVWSDPWVPAHRPRSPLPKFQNQLLNHSLTVENLINLVDHTSLQEIEVFIAVHYSVYLCCVMFKFLIAFHFWETLRIGRL